MSALEVSSRARRILAMPEAARAVAMREWAAENDLAFELKLAQAREETDRYLAALKQAVADRITWDEFTRGAA